MEIRPIPALPPKRAGNVVFHSTNVSMWEIHDMAVYTQYKDNFDEIIGILERGYFGIEKRLGTGHKLPIRVIIEAGGCCGGWAGGGDVGYADGDFKSDGAMNWVRGVVIGEVVNGVTGAVTSRVAARLVGGHRLVLPRLRHRRRAEGGGARARHQVGDRREVPDLPGLRAVQGAAGRAGLGHLPAAVRSMVKNDKMDLAKIGANPSAIKTNYTVAYLSLAARQNLATRFMAAKVAADPAVVQAIMDAHGKLVQAGPTAPGWARFRMGNYQGP